MVDDPPARAFRVSVTPDTARFAEVLRVFARHVLAAADEIEHLATDGPDDRPDDHAEGG